MNQRSLGRILALVGWTVWTACTAPPQQQPAANTKKETTAVTEHFINSLKSHDNTLPNRAADIPIDWLDQVSKEWKTLDEESRDIAIGTAARMRNRAAGAFLLKVAGLPGESNSVTAAEALIDNPDAPDGNTILAIAQPVKDPQTRAQLYRSAGAHGAATAPFEPVAAKETDPEARRAALEAMSRLGHLPSLHKLFEITSKAAADDVIVLHDALIYVGDKRLAKALIPWLHKTDPVTRMGSDRSPAMIRQCDYALWTAYRLAAGVSIPANHIDNFAPMVLAAAKPVLQALPDLPPL